MVNQNEKWRRKTVKRILCLCLSVMLIFSAFISAQAAGCWYYEKNGTHDFEQTNVGMPSCTTNGYYVIECRQCGYSETVITQYASGHTWGSPTYKEPTCTEKGYTKKECSICNEISIVYAPATGHNMKDVQVLESATCEKNGSMRTRCSKCSLESTRVIPKLSHVYGNWTIIVASTDHSMGQRAKSCVNCGKKEEESFYPEGTLYRGMSKNDEVKHLQLMLIDLNFLNDKADGIFGKNTENAVRKFQKYANLEQTGVAYPQTLRELEKIAEAENNPSPTPTSEPTATPTPTPSPTPVASPEPTLEYPPCCTLVVDEQGNEQVIHCEDHQMLIDTYRALIKNTNDDNRRLRLCEQQRSIWQAEIDSLFDRLLENATEEEKGEIAMAKAGFSVTLVGQENLWKLSYKNDPVAIAEKACELLIKQCSDLCALAFAVDADGE